jgi:hypothetical protein
MHLTPDQLDRIVREIEALDYGRIIIEVCEDRDHVDIIVERRLRVRKQKPLHMSSEKG